MTTYSSPMCTVGLDVSRYNLDTLLQNGFPHWVFSGFMVIGVNSNYCYRCHDGEFVLCTVYVYVSWRWQKVQQTNRLCGYRQLTVPFTTGFVLLSLLLFLSCSLLTCSSIAEHHYPLCANVNVASKLLQNKILMMSLGWRILGIYFSGEFRDMASLASLTDA